MQFPKLCITQDLIKLRILHKKVRYTHLGIEQDVNESSKKGIWGDYFG